MLSGVASHADNAELVAARRRYKVLLRQRDGLIAEGRSDAVLDEQLKRLVDAFPTLPGVAASSATLLTHVSPITSCSASSSHVSLTATTLPSTDTTATTPLTQRGVESKLSSVSGITSNCICPSKTVGLFSSSSSPSTKTMCGIGGTIPSQKYTTVERRAEDETTRQESITGQSCQRSAYTHTCSMFYYLTNLLQTFLPVVLELSSAFRMEKTSFPRAHCVLLCTLALSEVLAQHYNRYLPYASTNMTLQVMMLTVVMALHVVNLRRVVRDLRGRRAVWLTWVVYVTLDVMPSFVLYSVVCSVVFAMMNLYGVTSQ